jgi:hypothetical protein
MPDFEFTNPDGKRFTVTGPQGAAPEQAWAVLQQHLTGAGSHRDSGPADWGAVPAEPEGPAKWGAVPEQPTAPPGFILDQPKAAKREQPKKNENEPGLVSGTGRAFSRGVPIVGGLLNKADAATNAGLSYVLNPMFDEKEQLHGSLGERYQQSLDTQNKMDEAFHAEYLAISYEEPPAAKSEKRGRQGEPPPRGSHWSA